MFLRKFPNGAHQGSENNNITTHMKTSIQSIYSNLLAHFVRISCTGALLLASALHAAAPVRVTTPTVNLPVIPAAKVNLPITPTVAPRTPSGPIPTLIVLVHGRTAAPEPSPLPIPNPFPVDPVARPGTLGYSRFYFDFPFVSSVLGNTNQNLFTKSGIELTQNNWQTRATSNGEFDPLANRFAFADQPPEIAGRFNGTAAALVCHDGSLGVGKQAQAVLAEINALYDNFKDYCTRDPELIVIAHSKGGLVCRYILSVPTGRVAGADLTNGPEGEEAIATKLRDKTRFLITLGTPHTGSPIADNATALRNGVESTQAMVDTIWGIVRTAASVGKINLPMAAPIQLSSLTTFLAGSPDDLGHLTSDFCREMNQGPLHPSRMARTDGSLIPVYCYGGRSPADTAYATPSHNAASGFLNNTPGIVKNTVHGLMVLDYALHNVIQSDWGTLTTVGAGKSLDLTRRTFSVLQIRGTGVAGLVPTLVKSFSAPGAAYQLPFTDIGIEGMPTYFVRNQGDGETDSDGMVAISSALGINLGTGTQEFFDHTQNIAPAGQARRPGSWYRKYSGDWNFLNHSTETKSATMGRELRQVIVGAGPKPSFTGPLSVQ